MPGQIILSNSLALALTCEVFVWLWATIEVSQFLRLYFSLQLRGQRLLLQKSPKIDVIQTCILQPLPYPTVIWNSCNLKSIFSAYSYWSFCRAYVQFWSKLKTHLPSNSILWVILQNLLSLSRYKIVTIWDAVFSGTTNLCKDSLAKVLSLVYTAFCIFKGFHHTHSYESLNFAPTWTCLC